MFIKNCWYVIGWSSELGSENFLARTLLNTPVVLWRKADGNIVAFEDLCCHRGAPLSKGRREGDAVEDARIVCAVTRDARQRSE